MSIVSPMSFVPITRSVAVPPCAVSAVEREGDHRER
jgi:hypothetical protein